jgi:anaerobic selenocysteine-containing dehydrogenase
VASFFVKRAMDKGAHLIVVDGEENGLSPLASMNLQMSDIAKAIELAKRADSPAVVYGAGVTPEASEALKELVGKAHFLALQPGVNTRAAIALGLNNGFDASAADTLFVLAGEHAWNGDGVLDKLEKDAFLVVQASYESPLTKRADLVLPMAIWSERAGSLTNTMGLVQRASAAVEPQGQAKPDWEILSLLAGKMDMSLGSSLDEISALAAEQLK